MCKIRILEKSTSSIILLSLLKANKPVGLTQLVTLTKSNAPTISHRVVELQILGLISEEIERKFQGRRIFKLTDKGERIAKHLSKIESILNQSSKKTKL